MKTQVISILLIALTVSQAAQMAPILKQEKEDTTALYYINVFRGFWSGLSQGLYHSSKKHPSETCLDDKVVDDIMQFANIFTKGMDTSNLFALLPKAMEIMNSLQSCSFETTFEELFLFCDTHAEKCQPQAIMDNATKNMFVLMGKFTEITEVIGEFPAETPKDVYEQTQSLGNDIGTIIRVLIGFQ